VFRNLSLRARLVIGVSAVVALVLTVQTVLEIRLFEQATERELRETGIVTAEAVVDDLELRPQPWRPEELAADLREFAQAAPSVRAISIVRREHGGPVTLASTSSTEERSVLALAAEALSGGAPIWRDDRLVSRIALEATPSNGEPVAVVVTISLLSIEQLQTRGRLVSLWLLPLSIVALTLVLDQVLRRMVYRPIAALRDTMRRASAGDRTARVPVARRDEMGELAVGFNAMLDDLGSFNQVLEARIAAVTAELSESHAERIESYRRMLGLRDLLAHAERLATVGQTAASVAHQVGTPLNLISGHVQLLLADASLDPDLARRLRLVQEQIARVTDAIRGLVEQSRSSQVPSAIDVAALLGSITDLLQPRLAASGIGLDVQIASPLASVRGQRDELEMALLNLFTNAIDAMPEGGRLQLRAEPGEDGVTLEITDTGSGIAPELLARIFEPWVTTKAPGRGTGLGLSITRDVVTRHGGTVVARSTPGIGTTFTITLPAEVRQSRDDANTVSR
jgi:signal transduction histidine kinase